MNEPLVSAECREQTVRRAVDAAKAKRDGYVRLPRSFVTEIMKHLRGAELKLALAGYLETIGRDQESAGISLRRFQDVTGLERSPVARTLKRLAALGIMERGERWDQAGDRAETEYRLSVQPLYEKKPAKSGPARSSVVTDRSLPSDSAVTTCSDSAVTTGSDPGAREVVTCRSPYSEYSEAPTEKRASEATRPQACWSDELMPIKAALQEHAEGIGKTAELERDVDLGRKLAEAAGGNPYMAASVIGKKCYREFSRRTAVRRRPWPESFGFWITVLREEFRRNGGERRQQQACEPLAATEPTCQICVDAGFTTVKGDPPDRCACALRKALAAGDIELCTCERGRFWLEMLGVVPGQAGERREHISSAPSPIESPRRTAGLARIGPELLRSIVEGGGARG